VRGGRERERGRGRRPRASSSFRGVLS